VFPKHKVFFAPAAATLTAMADLVRLTIVPNEPAADLLCALLREEGIACGHQVTDVGAGALDGVAPIGSRAVFVAAADLERARELAESDARA
jgi:hypothetical protein